MADTTSTNSYPYSPVIIKNDPAIEWWQSNDLVPYPYAMDTMKQRIQDIEHGKNKETIWFLQHPSIITKGIRSQSSDLLEHNKFPVFETNRGGELTYHGPGQLIVYVMINLSKRTQDVRKFVHDLESWGINVLKTFGIHAECKQGRVGLWVDNQNNEKKIASIGVRITKWITWHGIALNIDPELKHFDSIVPCGLHGYGVTSLKELHVSNKNFNHVVAEFMRLCPF